MDKDVATITTTQMDAGVPDYSVSHKIIDEAGQQRETYWYNSKWSEYLGDYKQTPEFKETIKALARWTVGKGFETDNSTQVLLDGITGWGEDSFQAIMTNMLIVKKVNGDSFSEIMRSDSGSLINIKPLNPANVRTVVNPKGLIIRYDIWQKGKWTSIETSKILHLSNDRIANEIHGISALEACKWVLDARNEAMRDWRRISHRSTIRVMYVDFDDATRLNLVRTQYKEAIENGEVLLIPAKKGEAELEDITTPPIQPFIEWIRYLEGFIYQALGVPKAIANTADFTEAASKVGYMTFEPVYTEEQTLLEQDLWNQLAIKIKFNRPPSLSGVMQEDEEKNTGQVGFQPSETTATAGRVE